MVNLKQNQMTNNVYSIMIKNIRKIERQKIHQTQA